MRKKINKIDKRKIISNIIIVLLIVIFIVASLMMISEWESQRGIFTGSDVTETGIDYNGEHYELKDNLQTILVMGLDKFADNVNTGAYSNDQQADFLILIIIDRDNKTYSAVHINRDTMTEITRLSVDGQAIGTGLGQIALAHAYGSGGKDSCRNAVLAVSDFLGGITIDHYISLTMDAVPLINDKVGGVTVTIEDDFSGIDDTLVQGQQVTLKGEQALNYVRTRYGMEDSTNVARMERQREYLTALYEEVIRCVEQDEEFIVNTSLELADYMVTDCTSAQLERFFEFASEYEVTGINTIEGKSVEGDEFMEFYADEDALQKLVIELFYEK